MRRSDGQSLAEFALVLPILLIALLGLFDAGRAVYAYTTISNAAREGVRVAIVDQSSSGGTYTAQDEAAASSIALGVTPADVDVAFYMPDGSTTCAPPAIGCIAEVVVPYRFSAITPLIGQLIGPIDMSASSRVPVERSYP